MQIAPLIGISDETLRKYYRRELDLGLIEANAKVAEALFRQATVEGNTAAAIWWTKARMGWRERTGAEYSGSLAVAVRKPADSIRTMDLNETAQPVRCKNGPNSRLRRIDSRSVSMAEKPLDTGIINSGLGLRHEILEAVTSWRG